MKVRSQTIESFIRGLAIAIATVEKMSSALGLWNKPGAFSYCDGKQPGPPENGKEDFGL